MNAWQIGQYPQRPSPRLFAGELGLRRAILGAWTSRAICIAIESSAEIMVAP